MNVVEHNRAISGTFSNRVTTVAVTCLQALAFLRLGINIPEGTARELIMIFGSIEGAFHRLELISNVHSSSGSKEFINNLILAEGQLVSAVAQMDAINAVIAVREIAYKNQQLAAREARENEFHLDAINREIRDWSKNSIEFRNSLNALYKKTIMRLKILGLNIDDMTKAEEELEWIIDSAIMRYRDEYKPN